MTTFIFKNLLIRIYHNLVGFYFKSIICIYSHLAKVKNSNAPERTIKSLQYQALSLNSPRSGSGCQLSIYKVNNNIITCIDIACKY